MNHALIRSFVSRSDLEHENDESGDLSAVDGIVNTRSSGRSGR